MDRKTLLSQLELAYAPLTAYEFAKTKNDKLIELALQEASLYIIAQRPVITFENVSPDLFNFCLTFDVHQKGSDTILKGSLPLIQKVAGSKKGDNITISFNFLNSSSASSNKTTFTDLFIFHFLVLAVDLILFFQHKSKEFLLFQ